MFAKRSFATVSNSIVMMLVVVAILVIVIVMSSLLILTEVNRSNSQLIHMTSRKCRIWPVWVFDACNVICRVNN